MILYETIKDLRYCTVFVCTHVSKQHVYCYTYSMYLVLLSSTLTYIYMFFFKDIEGLEPERCKCQIFTGEPKQILIELESAAVAMY